MELWITGPPIALGLLLDAMRPPDGWRAESQPDHLRLTVPDPRATVGSTVREGELRTRAHIAEAVIQVACAGRDDIHRDYFDVQQIGELGDWA